MPLDAPVTRATLPSNLDMVRPPLRIRDAWLYYAYMNHVVKKITARRPARVSAPGDQPRQAPWRLPGAPPGPPWPRSHAVSDRARLSPRGQPSGRLDHRPVSPDRPPPSGPPTA